MLAHVGHLAADIARELAHGPFPRSQRLEDAQPLRIGEGATDGGEPLSLGLARDRRLYHGR